ncbi:MAG: hypothetical protein RLN88_00805 [Ekhidna sp.]|uniref:hypothetical protein n=1 Tax=Ekhidna sp. TaxID=2608089 RepID=UPI0032ED56A0
MSSALSESNLILKRSLVGLQEPRSVVFFNNDYSFFGGAELNLDQIGELSHSPPRWTELLRKDNSADLSGRLILLSDFQGEDLAGLREHFSDTSKSYSLILTRNLNELGNVAIDSLYVQPNPDELSEMTIKVTFRVFNMESGSLVIKLMKEGRQLSSIVKEASELDEIQFSIANNEIGAFSLEIDGDEVGYDNTFDFTVADRKKPIISIIEQSDPRFLREVFANTQLFNVHVQKPGDLDYEKLSESDLIVLSDLIELPVSLIEQFAETTFLVFPNDSSEISSYGEFLGINLAEADGSIAEIDIDYQHPLFEGVFEKSVDEGMMIELNPLFLLRGDFESIMKFRYGNSFLTRKNKTYFFNSSMGTTGFQSSALFLPVMYQLAFSASNDIQIPYYYPGDRIVTQGQPSDNPVRILNEDTELIPSFNSNGGEIVLEIPQDISSGFYFLVQNEDTLKQIAINIPKQESIMQAPTIDELKDAFANVENVEVLEALNQSSDRPLLASAGQSSLWKYALFLAVLLVLTETMLHRYLK